MRFLAIPSVFYLSTFKLDCFHNTLNMFFFFGMLLYIAIRIGSYEQALTEAPQRSR